MDSGSRPLVSPGVSRGYEARTCFGIGGCIGREGIVVRGASNVETLGGRINNTIECLSGVLMTAVVRPKYFNRYFCVYRH